MGNIVLDFLSIKYGCTHINLNSVDVLPMNKQDENKQATFFVYYICFDPFDMCTFANSHQLLRMSIGDAARTVASIVGC